MANLTFIEKNQLEKLLNMKSGYVLNFSDRTFSEFVEDSTGKNIYASKYEYASGSKANRLRKFWSVESDEIVGKLTESLLTYLAEDKPETTETTLFQTCRKIAVELMGGKLQSDRHLSPVAEVEEATPKASSNSARDPRNVFVVHGRNVEARTALFRFLRSIGLRPLEWSHTIELTGKAAPYIGEILDVAFTNA